MSTPCRLELGVTEGVAGNGRRRCNGELPIPASGRHGMIQPSEYLPGRLRVGQTIGLDIKGHGQNEDATFRPRSRHVLLQTGTSVRVRKLSIMS